MTSPAKLHLGIPVSDYTPPAHESLIDYRFALNRVGLLGGAEKSAKSQFNALLATCVSDNQIEFAPGVRVNETGNVVIFSTERTDDYFARVEVAGADISKVRIVNAERGYDWERVIADIENIRPENNVRLIEIDHIGDLSDKEIRSIATVGKIVNRLTAQAMRLRCCILLTTHTVKSAGNAKHFRQTFGGSIAWLRKVSDAWGMCLIKKGVGVIEHGIGTKKRFESCWEYRITDKVSKILDDKGQPIESEFLTIEGDSPVSYLKAFNMTEDGAKGHVSKGDQAQNLLRQTLANGEVANDEIKELAQAQDISERTLWTAAKALGIVTSGGPGSKWSLPKSANSAKSASDYSLHTLQSSQPQLELALTEPRTPPADVVPDGNDPPPASCIEPETPPLARAATPRPAKRVSLFRYPGGKFSKAPYYSSLIGTCETIIEPFVGGGHLTVFALLSGVAKRARINDIDPGVSAFWKVLFEGSDSEYRLLKKLINRQPTVEEFEWLKEDGKLDDCDLVERAFHFIYLNRTTFGGLITSGCLGGVAQDKNTIDSRYNAARFIEGMDALRVFKGKVTVTCGDFAECIAHAGPGDVIFADPPYVGAGGMLYTKEHQLMSTKDHERVAATLKDADTRGARLICTYDDDPTIRANYNGFNICDQAMRYSADGERTFNKTKNELLITNFDSPQLSVKTADIDTSWLTLVTD
jgi:DNA adenine methylase